MVKKNSGINQPDIGLIERCKMGDTVAFKKLVETMQLYAYHLSFRILLNQEEAKDAVQDSFIKIWKNISNYKPDCLFSTWMYKIVLNTCLDRLRTVKNHIEMHLDTKTMATDVEESIINKDLAANIRQISKGLPQKQRIIFILSDLQGLNLEEISEILNSTKGMVKSNLYYARKNIREKLVKLE